MLRVMLRNIPSNVVSKEMILPLSSHQRWQNSKCNSLRYSSSGRTEAAGSVITNELTETSSMLAGFWQTLSTSTPVAYIQQGLMEIHDFTGLPWWASIVVSTVLFRSIVTLPLTIYQQMITARIEALTLEMPAIVAELKKEAAIARKKFDWTEKQTKLVYNRSLRKQWNNLIIRDNCHPAKTLIVLWAQIPLWICQSVAIRNLVQMLPNPMSIEAQVAYMQLTVGGFGWIPNLTEVDGSFILPVALGLTNLAIIEIQSMTRNRPSTRLQNVATNVFRVMSIAMIPIACSVPSALCVYWLSSSAYGLGQNLLLLSPTVKRMVGIRKSKAELADPYNHLWEKIKIRSGFMKAPAKPSSADGEKSDNSAVK